MVCQPVCGGGTPQKLHWAALSDERVVCPLTEITMCVSMLHLYTLTDYLYTHMIVKNCPSTAFTPYLASLTFSI